MRAVILSILAVAASAVHAGQPECIPANLALTTSPLGTPIAKHTDRPSLFVSSNHGLAAYWYCQGPGQKITFWEVHGTPKAILEAGGASVLEMLYIKDRDASLNKLSATACNRSDIADADERQLCQELLKEVIANWPTTPLAKSP